MAFRDDEYGVLSTDPEAKLGVAKRSAQRSTLHDTVSEEGRFKQVFSSQGSMEGAILKKPQQTSA